MKILIVSGFLGAGKTTFIKALAKRSGRDFVILENEYGQAGVDGALLEAPADGGMNVWELTEGCICCSMKADFAASVLTIANSLDPEYLVVEPTGVGMLSSIIANLQQIEYERIALLRPLTILDGNSYQRYSKEFSALYRDQIEAAGLILFSKMEQADESERESLRDTILALNPKAQIVSAHYSGMGEEWWRGILSTLYDGSSVTPVASGAPQSPDLENIGFSAASLLTENHLIVLLEDVVRGEYGDICRAKGFLRAGSSHLRFDVADGRYSITEMEGSEECRVVFIGRDLARQRLRRQLLPIMRLQSRVRKG